MGVYRGHAAVGPFFEEWLGTFEEFYAHPEEFVDAGDPRLVVQVRQGGRGKGERRGRSEDAGCTRHSFLRACRKGGAGRGPPRTATRALAGGLLGWRSSRPGTRCSRGRPSTGKGASISATWSAAACTAGRRTGSSRWCRSGAGWAASYCTRTAAWSSRAASGARRDGDVPDPARRSTASRASTTSRPRADGSSTSARCVPSVHRRSAGSGRDLADPGERRAARSRRRPVGQRDRVLAGRRDHLRIATTPATACSRGTSRPKARSRRRGCSPRCRRARRTAWRWTRKVGYGWRPGGRGSIVRFEPDGSLDRELDVPAPFVSSLCFGGEDMRDLYVTTGDGKLLRGRSDVPGLARPGARLRAACCRPTLA